MQEVKCFFLGCSLGSLPDWLRGYAEHFLNYAHTFMGQDQEVNTHIELKCAHTFKVVQAAQAIAGIEKVFQDKMQERILLLAALFHDIARFEQFARFKTFADPMSFNHGHYAVAVLYRLRLLQKEPKEMRLAVLQSIAVHNALAVPAWEKRLSYWPMLALRDADKLDILRIMQGHLGKGKQADSAVVMHLKDEPGKYSPAILQALQDGRVGLYQDMRYFNDFRLLLCSWVGELYFPASKKIFCDEQLIEPILQGLGESSPELSCIARNAVTRLLERNA